MKDCGRLELVFHPAKDHPIKAAILGFVLGIAFQALWQAIDPVSAVLLAVLLLAAVRDFFLETRYCFDGDGISVRGALKPSKTYPWQRFRSYIVDRNGLFLSPYMAKRSLEQQRGVFLPLTPEGRAQAAEFCANRQLQRRAS